jgi:hypothetical protein
MNELQSYQKHQYGDDPALCLQTTSEGFLLKEKVPPKIGFLGYFFMVTFFFTFAFSFIGIFLSLFEVFKQSQIFFLCVVVITAIIIFPVIYYILLAIFNSTIYLKLLPSQLILSQYPLKLRGADTFTFRRELKDNKIISKPGKLSFILSCVERVQYTRGTDTETQINTIYESQVMEKFISEGINIMEMKQSFKIPSHLPPSFEGKKNQIRWVLSIHQDFPEIPKNTYSHFTLIVDPVIRL